MPEPPFTATLPGDAVRRSGPALTAVLHDFASLLAASLSRFDDVQFEVLAIALVFQAGNLVFRSLAWRNVLAAAYPEERVPLVGIGASYAAGMALNGFVPARAGEALKIGLARTQIQNSSVVTIAAGGTVVMLLDAVVTGAFLATVWWSGVLPAAPHLGVLDALRAHSVAAGALALVLAVVAAYGVHHIGRRARRLAAQFAQGGAILRTPRAYALRVVLPQLAAWTCRIGVAFTLLVAFGLPATIPLALVVIVAGGASTLASATPGGMGTQQVLLVYALGSAASASSALTFSIGMQIGVTAVNTAIGIAAVMLLTRTLHPVRAVRAGLRARA